LKELLCIGKYSNTLFKEEHFCFYEFFKEKDYLHKNMYLNIKKFSQFLRRGAIFKMFSKIMYLKF